LWLYDCTRFPPHPGPLPLGGGEGELSPVEGFGRKSWVKVAIAMKLTEMKQILASGQIQLTKSLGQNFLHDGNQLRRIVDAAELTKADKVLEIGPGLGPLTELLVERTGEVLAIEKDRRLVDFLLQKFAGVEHLKILHDDALDYVKTEKRDWSEWKLVANLPYSVASPILVELAQAEKCPQRLVATLQLEVAQRLVAKADEDDYGVLSLLMQLRYEPLGNFKIPAECFFPAPDVDSACVALKRRETPLLPMELHAAFDRLVKRGFSQRRKMMLKLLKQDWPVEKLTSVFEQLGLSPQIRAEKVSLEQFVELTKRLL
jgi:16S rRNA (adenine1518-N6/adenine1519-N6)-dimethyltransferase